MSTVPSHLTFLRKLYPVGAALTLFPMADIASRLYPANFGNIQWRFAAVGLGLSSLSMLLVGLALVGLTAAVRDDRAVLRALALIATVIAVVVLASIAVFLLDTLQVRSLVQDPAGRPPLYEAASTAIIAGILSAIALVGVAVASWSTARDSAALPGRGKVSPRNVVVFPDTGSGPR